MSVSLILDVVIAAILLLCLVIGGSRGFVSSLLSVVILAVALVGSGIVANLVSGIMLDRFGINGMLGFCMACTICGFCVIQVITLQKEKGR